MKPAVFQCPDCGGPVSYSAAACPRCGRPRGRAIAEPRGWGFWLGFALQCAGGLLLVAGIFACLLAAVGVPAGRYGLASVVSGLLFLTTGRFGHQIQGLPRQGRAGVFASMAGLTLLSFAIAHLFQQRAAVGRVEGLRRDADEAAKQAALSASATVRDRAFLVAVQERQDQERADRVAMLKAGTPAVREAAVRACIRAGTACSERDLTGIISSASTEAERVRLGDVGYTVVVEGAASLARDGTTISEGEVGLVRSTIAQAGTRFFKYLKTTTLAEALKSPSAARGKVLSTAGNVVEIREEGGSTHGSIMVGEHVVYFLTPLSTEGVVQGSWASLKGVMLQEYAYANVSGGQTRSILVVGALNGR
jgi:hypothetical protein